MNKKTIKKLCIICSKKVTYESVTRIPLKVKCEACRFNADPSVKKEKYCSFETAVHYIKHAVTHIKKIQEAPMGTLIETTTHVGDKVPKPIELTDEEIYRSIGKPPWCFIKGGDGIVTPHRMIDVTLAGEHSDARKETTKDADNK